MVRRRKRSSASRAGKLAIDPRRTLVLVAAWPDRQCRPEIIAWLLSNGFDVTDPCVLQTYSGLGKTDYEIPARNLAVRDIALKSAARDFIFIDKDIVPGPATGPFLQLIGDIIGAEFPTACPGAWHSGRDVHAGLLRCSRAVLEALAPGPWFMREYSPDGCRIVKCPCQFFRDRALAAGFAVARAGRCGHGVMPVAPTSGHGRPANP